MLKQRKAKGKPESFVVLANDVQDVPVLKAYNKVPPVYVAS